MALDCFSSDKNTYENVFRTIYLAKEKQLDHLPWREGEAFSNDKSLLRDQSEGLADENDSEGEPNHHFPDKLR